MTAMLYLNATLALVSAGFGVLALLRPAATNRVGVRRGCQSVGLTLP